jgi:hypothetical protein
LGSALSIVVPVVIVAGMFLSLYVARDERFPAGYDTPKYIWRANLVEAEGPRALAGSVQPPLHANADRPGFPVLTALLHDATGITPFDLMFVLPGVMAAAIGLGAGVFALRILREPEWAFPVYAIAVGASVNVARTAYGYADTLIVLVILMAVATTALLFADRRPGAGATVLLLAGAALIHWIFAAVFGAILLGVAVLLLPQSLRARRDGARVFGTPSERLVALVTGSAAAGSAALALAAVPLQPPGLGRPEFLRKLAADVRRYVFPFTATASAAGVAALWWVGRDRLRRWGLALVLVWAGSSAAAVVLLLVGAAFPAHRFISFALGIPILIAAALTGLARFASRRLGGGGRAAGTVVVLAGLGGGAFLGYRAWSEVDVWMRGDRYVQSEAAGRYLDRVGGERPAVFIVDRRRIERIGPINLKYRLVRVGLPGDQIKRTYVYLGDPTDLLAGRPTTGRDPKYDQISRHFWLGVRRMANLNPIVIDLRSFDPFFNRHVREAPGFFITPDAFVMNGPRPTAAIDQPSVPSVNGAGELAGLSAAVIALLFGVGLGWSVSLGPRGPQAAAALAPAFGIATLVLGGVIADRLGASITGPPAVTIVSLVAAVGWMPLAVRWRPRRPGRNARGRPRRESEPVGVPQVTDSSQRSGPEAK